MSNSSYQLNPDKFYTLDNKLQVEEKILVE